MRHLAIWLKALVALVAFLVPVGGSAHEIVPAIVDFNFASNGAVEISIKANAEALVAQIGPQHSNTNDSPNAADYDRLRSMEPDAFATAFAQFAPALAAGISLTADGQAVPVQFERIDVPAVGDTSLARESLIHLSAQLPTGAQAIVWSWDTQFGASIIRVMDGGEEPAYSEYVLDGMTSKPVNISGPQPRGFLETVGDYMAIGFTHIVPKGLDHILFVVGIFLASTRLKPLLIQVSSFTVAHTVSLALGALGLVVVDPRIVEPLIALSIAYVCIENIWFGHLTVWRPFVVFGFGLLHGLGFAGVLGEVGLPASEFITGLISFNLGVELGQLTVILICFLLVGFWFGSKPFYRKLVVVPVSTIVGLVGLFWFVERIVTA